VQEGRVKGVKTDQGVFHASILLDAAGSHHWLAKQLDLPIQPYSAPLRVCYGYGQGNCPSRDEAPAIIADGQGWTWTAKVSGDRYQWTRLTFNSQPIARSWVPTEFAELKPLGRSQVADVTWRSVDRPAGPGYFLLGDAATVVDPAASHGVLKAIMSGMMAGHLIELILKDTDLERKATQEYCRWTQGWFLKDIERLKALYQKWNPSQANP
jgi:flavin-dependent dehydrogenase